MSVVSDAERIKVLEARVAELERQLQTRPAPQACPVCGVGTFKVVKVNVGNHKRTLKCDNAACGHVERRARDPMRLA